MPAIDRRAGRERFSVGLRTPKFKPALPAKPPRRFRPCREFDLMASINSGKKRIAILTGGGDVPGLNPAIRAVTIRALR